MTVMPFLYFHTNSYILATVNQTLTLRLGDLWCKLYTKEMNPKPTHKSSIAAADILKLRGYFSEGLDSNNSWADPERLLQFVWFSTLFSFWSEYSIACYTVLTST